MAIFNQVPPSGGGGGTVTYTVTCGTGTGCTISVFDKSTRQWTSGDISEPADGLVLVKVTHNTRVTAKGNRGSVYPKYQQDGTWYNKSSTVVGNSDVTYNTTAKKLTYGDCIFAFAMPDADVYVSDTTPSGDSGSGGGSHEGGSGQ